VGCFEYGNELSGSVKSRLCLD